MGTGQIRESSTSGRRKIDAVTGVVAVAVLVLLVIAGNGRTPPSDAAPPPPGGFAHGAAGSGRNGLGGSIAASPTMRSWPGTGLGGNGGPFSFIGAHYGAKWQVPAGPNNSQGVGYCVMEDLAGEGAVALQHDPAVWDVGEMARAAALMSGFGGDRVVPYGIDSSGPYDVGSGEWQQPSLFGGGEYTRRRQVAVNFGVKMFLDDVSPSGAVAGLKLARDTAVVNGSGGEFSALRNGYVMAQRLATVAEIQHAVGGVHLQMVWSTPDGVAPAGPGNHAVEVRATDGTGKPVGYVPIVVMSDIGIDGARTIGATASVDRTGDSVDDTARWAAAAALGWPTMDMAGTLATDARFGVGANPAGADVTDSSGVARFAVTIVADTWELAFHTQAPTPDVSLYSGTGIQGQVTWTASPQSASVHIAVSPPPPPPPPPPAPVVGAFAVRKVLDAVDVQASRDMSGFEFEVTAADATPIGRLTTAADGRTQSIEAVAGTYTVRETARPSWAGVLGDPGPVAFGFEPTSGSDVREIAYVNTVPDASIATAARDASDGDQVIDVEHGTATIIDTVTYTSLVPGTDYVVTGELMVRPTNTRGGAINAEAINPAGTIPTGTNSAGNAAESGFEVVASSTVALSEMIPTGVTGSTSFVPGGPDGSVEVEFAIPADSPLLGHTVVVFQRLEVASSGRVVATHADPDAADQTIRIAAPAPPPTTTTPTTTTPTTTTPTTTTPTTTTVAPSTTVVVAVEPPLATTTTTTQAPPTVSTTTTPPVATPLPRTGTDSSRSLAIAAITLVLLGVALLSATRRPTSRPR